MFPVSLLLSCLLSSSAAAPPARGPQSDLIVSAGQTLVYDTSNGPIFAHNVVIEAGGTLRAVGPLPLRVYASRSVKVDGELVLDGFDSPGVATLNTGDILEAGAHAGPAGGAGGSANTNTTGSTAKGRAGNPAAGSSLDGGAGGESGYGLGNVDNRRPGGGGGGALAPDQPVHSDPNHPSNLGLIAEKGRDGNPTATGALSGQQPPAGGARAAIHFVDNDPTNDFWGRKLEPSTGTVIVGELGAPIGGSGGGGGGNAVPSATFPNPSWSPASDEKGAGGGGGGGLGIVVTPLFAIGGAGHVQSDGGDGGGGENTLFLNRVGGGSGGGSGGFLLIQARRIDLSQASDKCLTALGGRGGPGKSDLHGAINGGGNGGPGLVQLHVADPANDVLLPAGKTLADLSSPKAHVLLPEPGL